MNISQVLIMYFFSYYVLRTVLQITCIHWIPSKSPGWEASWFSKHLTIFCYKDIFWDLVAWLFSHFGWPKRNGNSQLFVIKAETGYICRTNCRYIRACSWTTVSVSLLDDSYSSLCYKLSWTCLRLLVFCLHWWDHHIRHLDLTSKLWMQRNIYCGAEYKHETQYNLILPISARKC